MDHKLKPKFSRYRNSLQPAAFKATEAHPSNTALSPRFEYLVHPTYNAAPISDDEDDSAGNLIEILHVLRRHKRTIIVSSLFGLALGFVIGIPLKPKFRAETTLEVLTLNGDFMNQKTSNPTTTNDNNFDTSEEQTQAKLLEGSALLDRVMVKLDPGWRKIETVPALATTGWRSWLHLREPVDLTDREKLLRKAADSLKIRPTARTRVLDVTVDSTDPQLATDFANSLTREFIAQNIEARWATVQNTSEWLQRELEDARQKLRMSEDALQKYAATSGLIFTEDDTNVATEKLQQVQQSLSAAIADRITKQSSFELAQKAPPDTLGDVLSDEGLQDTVTKLSDAKKQLANANTVFAPESSKVQRLQAELQSLQESFDTQRSDILARIKNDYTQAERKEKLLADAYDMQSREVTGQDEKAIQYNILKRDVDSNRQLYDTMLQQMKQASIASAIRAGNVRVVDPAVIPDLPVFPNFKLNSALGLCLGFLGSVVFVILREHADKTLQQPGDIKMWTDILELGVIPNASLSDRIGNYYLPAAQANGIQENGHLKPHRKGPKLPHPELIMTSQTSSASAEAFRSLLTSMLFINEDSNRPRVMVFTSANAGDGKTTVVSNIGIAAAEIRMNVLLIDADLRRPRLHQVFKVPDKQGLADILTGDMSEDDTDRLIQPTGVKNLSLLPAGAPTLAAPHLLYSPMWNVLLEKFREQYDMILIDTPPMLQMTDARVAARMADGVVLVARSTMTTRDVLMAAKDRLTEDHISILGAILNDWDPKQSPNGYYGYHRSNYYLANHYASH